MNVEIEPLTHEAFKPFGDVVDRDGAARHYTINEGYAERYHDIAKLDVEAEGGRPLLNIFRARPRVLPLRITMMERHPLSSQAFIPLTPRPFLVLVARPGEAPSPGDLRCFQTERGQGVNYARGTWHHPLITLEADQDFLVLDRGGDGKNCDEINFVEAIFITPAR